MTKRMTAAAIRAATPHPKPQGAIDKLRNPTAIDVTTSREYSLLESLAEGADILDVETSAGDSGFARCWLLVNLTAQNLDALMNFSGRLADREPDEDREDDHDNEPETDGELENEGTDYGPAVMPDEQPPRQVKRHRETTQAALVSGGGK